MQWKHDKVHDVWRWGEGWYSGRVEFSHYHKAYICRYPLCEWDPMITRKTLPAAKRMVEIMVRDTIAREIKQAQNRLAEIQKVSAKVNKNGKV